MDPLRGLDDWLTRGPDEQDHDKRCPLSDDYEVTDGDDLYDRDELSEKDCICADLEADAKADAAQAKVDAWKERNL